MRKTAVIAAVALVVAACTTGGSTSAPTVDGEPVPALTPVTSVLEAAHSSPSAGVTSATTVTTTTATSEPRPQATRSTSAEDPAPVLIGTAAANQLAITSVSPTPTSGPVGNSALWDVPPFGSVEITFTANGPSSTSWFVDGSLISTGTNFTHTFTAIADDTPFAVVGSHNGWGSVTFTVNLHNQSS